MIKNFINSIQIQNKLNSISKSIIHYFYRNRTVLFLRAFYIGVLYLIYVYKYNSDLPFLGVSFLVLNMEVAAFFHVKYYFWKVMNFLARNFKGEAEFVNKRIVDLKNFIIDFPTNHPDLTNYIISFYENNEDVKGLYDFLWLWHHMFIDRMEGVYIMWGLFGTTLVVFKLNKIKNSIIRKFKEKDKKKK